MATFFLLEIHITSQFYPNQTAISKDITSVNLPSPTNHWSQNLFLYY